MTARQIDEVNQAVRYAVRMRTRSTRSAIDAGAYRAACETADAMIARY